MGHYIQVLFFVIIATVLLWFGYTLFFGLNSNAPVWGERQRRFKKTTGPRESFPGASQTCPVCSAKLEEGELVNSLAFPSLNGGRDRLMHIRGCAYCLRGDRPRICPVCGQTLRGDEFLVARMFSRSSRRSHVHVLGCPSCRKTGRSMG